MTEFMIWGLMRGVLVPALVSGVLYLLSRLAPGILRRTLRSASISAGVGLAFFLLIGYPTKLWTGQPDSLIGVLLIAAVFPVLESLFARRLWVFYYLLLMGVSALALWPLIQGHWLINQSIGVLVSVAGLGALVWWFIDKGSQAMHPAAVMATFLVLALGVAGFLFSQGSLALSQLSVALAATLILPLFLALRPKLRAGYELNASVVLVVFSLLLQNYSRVPVSWPALVYFLAPVAWIVLRGIVRYQFKSGFGDVIASLAISAAPIGWGLWQIYRGFN